MSLHTPTKVVPFRVALDRTDDTVTAMAGLPLAAATFDAAGLREACGGIHAKKIDKGPSDADWVLCALLTILMGGKTVEDAERLKDDAGLRRALPGVKNFSARYLLDFLYRFHDPKLVVAARGGARGMP